MTPTGKRFASMWLRDRAEELRAAARCAEGAYTHGGMHEAATYTATHYRKAAALLDEAAQAADDDHAK